ADGATITDTAATVGISRRFVYKWVKRFLEAGLEGLVDKPGRRSRRVPRHHPIPEQQHERALPEGSEPSGVVCLPCAGLHLSSRNAPLSPIEISTSYAGMLCLSCTLRP